MCFISNAPTCLGPRHKSPHGEAGRRLYCTLYLFTGTPWTFTVSQVVLQGTISSSSSPISQSWTTSTASMVTFSSSHLLCHSSNCWWCFNSTIGCTWKQDSKDHQEVKAFTSLNVQDVHALQHNTNSKTKSCIPAFRDLYFLLFGTRP